MSYEEFLRQFKRALRAGYTPLKEGDKIRLRDRYNNKLCPVTVVCLNITRERFKIHEYRKAGVRLGLWKRTTEKIACGADIISSSPGGSDYDPKLLIKSRKVRGNLLRICKL